MEFPSSPRHVAVDTHAARSSTAPLAHGRPAFHRAFDSLIGILASHDINRLRPRSPVFPMAAANAYVHRILRSQLLNSVPSHRHSVAYLHVCAPVTGSVLPCVRNRLRVPQFSRFRELCAALVARNPAHERSSLRHNPTPLPFFRGAQERSGWLVGLGNVSRRPTLILLAIADQASDLLPSEYATWPYNPTLGCHVNVRWHRMRYHIIKKAEGPRNGSPRRHRR